MGAELIGIIGADGFRQVKIVFETQKPGEPESVTGLSSETSTGPIYYSQPDDCENHRLFVKCCPITFHNVMFLGGLKIELSHYNP